MLLRGGSLLQITSLAAVKLLQLRTEGPGPAHSPTWRPARHRHWPAAASPPALAYEGAQAGRQGGHSPVPQRDPRAGQQDREEDLPGARRVEP